mmetsp:Transcript_25573/g.54600  ORF Transcript_25573/g.54600 Transcript_25573/m.54600 type:complete len:104 (+) Transcript_25573:1395-1706(+)
MYRACNTNNTPNECTKQDDRHKNKVFESNVTGQHKNRKQQSIFIFHPTCPYLQFYIKLNVLVVIFPRRKTIIFLVLCFPSAAIIDWTNERFNLSIFARCTSIW